MKEKEYSIKKSTIRKIVIYIFAAIGFLATLLLVSMMSFFLYLVVINN